jgi:uncharacterized membrane protein
MRNSKWLVIGLIASIAVNLALAGFVAGRISVPGPVPAGLDPSLSLYRVLHQLPDPRREAFRPTVRAHFHSMRGELRRMREAQRGINEALTQEPFEPEALGRALQDFRAALLDGQQDNHHVLIEVATSMTPEERLLLRDAMIRHRSRPPHGRPPSSFRDGGPAPR